MSERRNRLLFRLTCLTAATAVSLTTASCSAPSLYATANWLAADGARRMPVSTADLVSPAMACLRVSILAPPGAEQAEDLQLLVAKVINAFLQSRWEWPRRFEQMTPYSFVLTDPRADRMDKRGLRALASELQLKLFGSDGEGEVSLLLFEGSDLEVHRFAKLSIADVDRMAAGDLLNPPFEGSLDRIIGRARGEHMARLDARPAPPPHQAPPASSVEF